MGCCSSKQEGGGAAPFPSPQNAAGAVDQIHVPVSYTMTTQIQTSFLSTKTASKMETNDDVLLQTIVAQAAQNRFLSISQQKFEIPKIGVGASLAVATGGAIDIPVTLDCYFSPKQDQPINTVAVLVPVTVTAQIQTGLFSSKIDAQQSGWENVNATISQYYASGFRLSMFNFAVSGGSSGGMFQMNSSSSTVVKLVFQQAQFAADSPPPAYTEWFTFMFQTSSTFGAMGVKQNPFDLLSVLREHGAQGWEFVSLMPIPVMAANVGIGQPIVLLYQIIMQRKSNTPVEYYMKEVELQMSVGVTGATIKGDLSTTVNAAAGAGWHFKGQLPLAVRQKGMSQRLPFRLYFSSV